MWLPSHQGLRDHPKLRRASSALGVSRPLMVGHLHCLWWWALDYAPDGDLSRFDDEDVALAADWEGDPHQFVEALKNCGPGERPGFLDPDRSLHNWDLYAGKYDQRKASSAGSEGNHVRWHSKRGLIDPTCSFCRPESGGDIGGDRGAIPPESQSREEESREEEIAASPKRKHPIPDSWAPNDKHREIAAEVGADVSFEAQQFADFHRAKGSTFKDWDASFRTWLRNHKKFAPRHLRAVGDGVTYVDPPVRYT